jgi:hypothetical protein
MPKRSSIPKKRDENEIAFSVVEASTSPQVDAPSVDEIKRVMSALGRQGGLKGGKARAESLSAKRRSEIAQKAARKRWRKKRR